MGSKLSFVEFVADQMADAGEIRFRNMFGEYVVYCNDKVVALVCDDRLLVKPTKNGRAYIGEVIEEPPYPGAKPAFLIGDQIENREWLAELIRITEKELPKPKPKKKKKKK